MKLHVGERLEGAGPGHQPGGYVVTSVVRETPWHGLYTGKKIFYNFDFTAKRVRETDELEWLDVFLRINRYPILDDSSYVQQRRALARAEVRAILINRHSNLWPEPLDLLEIENTRDPFAFADETQRAPEPVLVYTRPQGQFAPLWQQQILPIASILAVLAELLEFMQQAHAERLLLLGLGPTALLIDSSDRVHYIGTDMVLAQSSALLNEATPAALWQRLFPADRFTRGYAAPECFDPSKRPDVRADLFAWGALAFNLLTGTDLIKIAHEQGRPWVALGEAHWNQLASVLAQLPKNSLLAWADQIGVEPKRLLEAWPTNFVNAFRLLLSPDPALRPRSTAELLTWLINPPPPPISALIALQLETDSARLLLDCAGITTEAGLEMTIQCTQRTPARLPTDGATVAEGALRPVLSVTRVPATSEPIFYTAFTRRKKGNDYVFSPGVTGQLWQPTETNLRQWVEDQSANIFDSQQIPTRVGMVLGALDVRAGTDSLLASAIPRVRVWALRRLELVLRVQGRTETSEALLWRFVADPKVEVRQSAAATLWTYHPNKTDDLLLRLLEALEAPPLDAPIPLMQFLRQLQLPEERSRAALKQLEAKRPTECPICKKPLSHEERGTHLQAVHGYVVYLGDLLPIQVVFARLWERALQQHDRQAHDELVDMYLKPPDARKNQGVAVERYVVDLQKALLGETKPGGEGKAIPVALPYAAVVAYQANLRTSKLFLPIVQQLLRSPQRRLRDLGSQTVLPFILDQLPPQAAVSDLRRLLNSVCDDRDYTDLQIDLCRQLAQLGVDQAPINACIAQLQDERLVACSECKAQVRMRDLEVHLRRAHQIFQFRGERKAYEESRAAILKAICTPPADLAAWKSLRSLAEDKHAQEADRYVVAWLYQFIKEIDAEQRGPAIAAIAEVAVAAETADRLLPLFAGPMKNTTWELLGQRLALEVCTRMPAPVPAKALPLLMPLLDIKELPHRARENAVLALMRSVGKNATLAGNLLRAYVAQSGRKRALEKLQELEHRFGHSQAIDTICEELDSETRMSCPRCNTELAKKEMIVHLWDKHRLVLDGQRVREPWRVIEDWVVDYGLEKDPQVLQRCRALALKDDPQAGLARLQRVLYRRGLRDRELLSELRSLVKTRKSTLCPHCCAPIPIAPVSVIEPLTIDGARLEGHGYHLEISERGLVPSLKIESPTAILFRDREPGRGLTRFGGVLAVNIPLIVLSFCLITRFASGGLIVACVALGIGLFGAGCTYFFWPKLGPVRERLLMAAWTSLVPEMLRGKMGRRDWSFLSGLVELSDEDREQAVSQDILLECCEEASKAARTDPLALACLVRLTRRCLVDMRDSGEPPYDFVTTLAGDCFKGKVPVSYLGDLLENFHGTQRSTWSKRDLNCLPILVANQAFSAEVDIDDWFNLGRAFPVLNTVLRLENRLHWLQFHSLWRQRSVKPWKSAGDAIDMVELASAPKKFDELLAHYPDVLLYIAEANLVIGSKGVWIEGVCVPSMPAGSQATITSNSEPFEIRVGTLTIRCAENPRPVLEQIKRWLRWYFQEFVPSVSTAPRPMTESRHRMWQPDKTTCPECSRTLVACPGDLGMALR